MPADRLREVKRPTLPFPVQELAEGLEKMGPGIAGQLADVLGVRVGRPTTREQGRARNRVRGYLEGIRPYVLGLEALDGRIPPALARYALFEGYLREHLRSCGVRIKKNEDGWDALLSALEKAATIEGPVTVRPAYADAHAAMVALARSTVPGRENWQALECVRDAWRGSPLIRRTIALIRRLPTVSRGWVAACPKRFTTSSVDRLAAEYSFSSKALETMLRYLGPLAEARTGTHRWKWWYQSPLAQILLRAANMTEFGQVRAVVDTNVRNALAHGVPETRFSSGRVAFLDMKQTVEWSFSEFFERTKELTASTVPLLLFEEIAPYEHMKLIFQQQCESVAEEAERARK